jgi:hypothetical protein
MHFSRIRSGTLVGLVFLALTVAPLTAQHGGAHGGGHGGGRGSGKSAGKASPKSAKSVSSHAICVSTSDRSRLLARSRLKDIPRSDVICGSR